MNHIFVLPYILSFFKTNSINRGYNNNSNLVPIHFRKAIKPFLLRMQNKAINSLGVRYIPRDYTFDPVFTWTLKGVLMWN